MTLEEKKAYINSLPKEERARFLVELSVHERNSIIKQMDPQSQADLASGFIDLGKDLGMNISVDKLGADGIDYSVRNEEGTLIAASTVGVSIDDTGWDTTVPVLTRRVIASVVCVDPLASVNVPPRTTAMKFCGTFPAQAYIVAVAGNTAMSFLVSS